MGRPYLLGSRGGNAVVFLAVPTRTRLPHPKVRGTFTLSLCDCYTVNNAYLSARNSSSFLSALSWLHRQQAAAALE